MGSVAPPLTTLSGSFSVTFDPALLNFTANRTLSVISSSYRGRIALLTFACNPTLSVLSFGGVNGGAGNIYLCTDDFVIQFNLSNPNAPRLTLCSDPGFSCGIHGNSSYLASGYALARYPGDFWLALAGTATPVDEPGGALLLAAGIASVAAAARARKTVGTDRS